MCFNIFLVTSCLVVAVQPCMVSISNLKKSFFFNRFIVFCCSLKVKINLSKKTGMKNGNATQTFREVMKLVLQVMEELPIKNKTAGSVGAP